MQILSHGHFESVTRRKAHVSPLKTRITFHRRTSVTVSAPSAT